jgi:hypothetical protein
MQLLVGRWGALGAGACNRGGVKKRFQLLSKYINCKKISKISDI